MGRSWRRSGTRWGYSGLLLCCYVASVSAWLHGSLPSLGLQFRSENRQALFPASSAGGRIVHNSCDIGARRGTCDIGARRTGSLMTVKMGAQEWMDGQPGPLRKLGCLPFQLQDILLPGETKNLHLYEARFLALFEEAIKSHGSCVGNLIFAGNTEINVVAPLGEIVEWRRQEVGIFVKIRCIGRVKVEDVVDDGDSPYLIVKASPYEDEVVDAQDLKFLTEEIYEAHAQCVQLQSKLDKIVPDMSTAPQDWEWGHEITDNSGAFKDSLAKQLQARQELLHSDPDIPVAQQEIRWNCKDKDSEEVQLLSFVAIAGFDATERLLSLNLQNTGARLMKARDSLAERQKLLTAKAALMELDLK